MRSEPINTLFGELRARLTQCDETLVRFLKEVEQTHPALYHDQWLPYLSDQLKHSGRRTTCYSLEDIEHTHTLAPGIDIELNLSSQGLTDKPLKQILSSPLLASVRALDLSFNRLTNAGIEHIARCPHLNKLHTLNLSINAFGDGVIYNLSNADSLESLRALDVSYQQISAQDLQWLNSPTFTKLQDLNLSNCGLTLDAIRTLFHTLVLPDLRTLSLEDNHLEECAQTIVNGRVWTQLTTLDLGGCKLRDQALITLVSKPWCPALTTLNISNNSVFADGLTHLARAPHWTLRQLNMTSTSMTTETLQGFADALTHPLNELDLTANRLNGDAVAVLSHAPALRTLRTLYLPNNPLGERTGQLLTASPHLQNLTLLHLNGTGLSQDGFEALAQAENLQSLRHLEVGANDLTTKNMRHLATSKVLTSLHILNMYNNPVGDEGVRVFANSPNAASIRVLNMAQCALTSTAIAHIATSKHMSSLHTLNANYNGLDDEALLALSTSRHLKRLRSLSIQGCHIQGAGIAAIFKHKLPNLAHLNAGDNPLVWSQLKPLASSPNINTVDILELRYMTINLDHLYKNPHMRAHIKRRYDHGR